MKTNGKPLPGSKTVIEYSQINLWEYWCTYYGN